MQTCGCGYGCFTRSAVKVAGALAVVCTADHDAEFIANAREDLPAALDLIDRCQALLEAIHHPDGWQGDDVSRALLEDLRR